MLLIITVNDQADMSIALIVFFERSVCELIHALLRVKVKLDNDTLVMQAIAITSGITLCAAITIWFDHKGKSACKCTALCK